MQTKADVLFSSTSLGHPTSCAFVHSLPLPCLWGFEQRLWGVKTAPRIEVRFEGKLPRPGKLPGLQRSIHEHKGKLNWGKHCDFRADYYWSVSNSVHAPPTFPESSQRSPEAAVWGILTQWPRSLSTCGLCLAIWDCMFCVCNRQEVLGSECLQKQAYPIRMVGRRLRFLVFWGDSCKVRSPHSLRQDWTLGATVATLSPLQTYCLPFLAISLPYSLTIF